MTSNSFLAALVVTAGSTNYNLLPDFDRRVRRYRIYLPAATPSMTVTPFVDNLPGPATIKVNGVTVTSGQPAEASHSIPGEISW